MKILYVVPDLIIGGVTTVVMNLIESLRERNVDIRLVTLFDQCSIDIGDLDKVSLKIESIFDVPFSILRLKKIIDDFEPDIVHTHTMYSHLLVYSCAYMKKNYKIISSEHGTYTSSLKFYKRMNWFKFMNPIADLVTNVSHASCESYISQNIVSSSRMRTMYNGINLDKYKFSSLARLKIRTDLNISENEKMIGFVGRLSKEKNLPNLINAVALLKLDYKLVLIGNGPENSSIRQLIEQLHMTDKVILLGEINDPCAYYSAMDLLVLSSDTEGLPTVILEAISSRCPVVATDCGGVKEVFPENSNYIAPITNSVILSEKINENLCLRKECHEKIIELNYSKICSTFSLDITIQNWLDLYEEFLNDNK